MNFAEIGKDPFDQFHGKGALGMPRPLNSFPCRRDGLRLGIDPCFRVRSLIDRAARILLTALHKILRVAGGWDKSDVLGPRVNAAMLVLQTTPRRNLGAHDEEDLTGVRLSRGGVSGSMLTVDESCARSSGD